MRDDVRAAVERRQSGGSCGLVGDGHQPGWLRRLVADARLMADALAAESPAVAERSAPPPADPLARWAGRPDHTLVRLGDVRRTVGEGRG